MGYGGGGGGRGGGGGGGGGGFNIEAQKAIGSISRKLEEVNNEKIRIKRGLEASKHELQQIHETAEKDKERLTVHIKRQHDTIQAMKSELEQNKSGTESKFQMVRGRLGWLVVSSFCGCFDLF